MSALSQPEDKKVAGQQFDRQIELTAAPTTPFHGLYQPYYPLSEADFMRLRKHSTVAAAMGSGLTVYGIVQGLPLVQLLLEENLPPNLPTAEWLIPLAAAAAGVIALLVGLTFSLDQRHVTRKIRDHFRDNPGQSVVVRKGAP